MSLNLKTVNIQNIDKYKYIDDNSLPLFLLGVVRFDEDSNENFNFFNFKNCNIDNLQHQVSGILCHSVTLYGYAFNPINDKYYKLIEELDKKYYNSSIHNNPKLSELSEYSNVIKQYNLNCEYSYIHLREGIYPIDIEYMKDIIGISYEDFEKEYVVYKENSSKFLNGLQPLWLSQLLNIYILTINSD
jgi:hypothetical protein